MVPPRLLRQDHPATPLRRTTALALVMIATCAFGPAFPAKVYRCGNVFQDQPCPELKVAAVTPSDRAPASRDTACTSATRDSTGRNDRGDCTARSGRDAPREVAADVKR